MTENECFARLEQVGVVPVIRARSAELAVEGSRAVVRGGITVLEITMTVPGACEVIRQLRSEMGDDVLVGVGTVLTTHQVHESVKAGAQFVVTPGLSIDVVRACQAGGVPVLPGALTPTEVIAAWHAGATCVKVFPCSALGGAKYLRSLRGPLPQVKLMPTGGVNLQTAHAYLAAGAVALGVGSELVDSVSLQSGDFGVIEERAREFKKVVQDARDMLGSGAAA